MPQAQAQAAVLDGEPAKVESTAPSGNRETVTVGCKLPNGLVLRVYDWHDHVDALAGGGTRQSKIARRRGNEEHVIHGNTIKFADLRAGNLPNHAIVGGFGLTTGIPKDFWETWYEQNKDTPLVKSGLVFAHSQELSARSIAKERETLRSGLEPIDPEKPYLAHPDFRQIRQGSRANDDE